MKEDELRGPVAVPRLRSRPDRTSSRTWLIWPSRRGGRGGGRRHGSIPRTAPYSSSRAQRADSSTGSVAVHRHHRAGAGEHGRRRGDRKGAGRALAGYKFSLDSGFVSGTSCRRTLLVWRDWVRAALLRARLPHGGPRSVVAAMGGYRLRWSGRDGARPSRVPGRNGARPSRPHVGRPAPRWRATLRRGRDCRPPVPCAGRGGARPSRGSGRDAARPSSRWKDRHAWAWRATLRRGRDCRPPFAGPVCEPGPDRPPAPFATAPSSPACTTPRACNFCRHT
jgi:hypothetical protein